MSLEWEPKIGPATIVSLIGSLGLLVALGIAWGTITTKEDNSVSKLDSIQTKVDKHDSSIADINNHVTRVETQLNTILPFLRRIEEKVQNPPAPSAAPPP